MQRLKESDERRAGDREEKMVDRPVGRRRRQEREREGMKRRVRAKKVMKKREIIQGVEDEDT